MTLKPFPAPGAVVQITSAQHKWYGSLWIVERMYRWGVQCNAVVPGLSGFGVIRLAHSEYTVVGQGANWDWAKPLEVQQCQL